MAVRAERCPSCRALLGPRLEGALAPDLSSVTPPRQDGPLVPAVKRRDRDRGQAKTWQEEVRDRVKHRRQKRGLPQDEAGENLPLFREAKPLERGAPRLDRPLQDWSARSPRREAVPATAVSAGVPPSSPTPAPSVEVVPVPTPQAAPLEPSAPVPSAFTVASEPNEIVEANETAQELSVALPPRVSPAAPMTPLVNDEEFDLPLRAGPLDPPDAPDLLRDVETPDEEPVRRGGIDLSALDRDLEGMACPSSPGEVGGQDEADTEWEPEEPDGSAPAPVARPALASERVWAAVIDVGLMGLIAVTVVYFASRVARVPFSGLWPAWPWFATWLVGVGLAYSAIFTGTTGQTLGKIATGLRVVDASDHPPGYGRALLRAIVGFVGVLVVGVGVLPSAFDPARRALHDRCFRTRVVRG